GDEIERVEITRPGGGAVRFIAARSPHGAPGVEERPLNPVRLPFDLSQFVSEGSGPPTVKLTVLRPAGHAERAKVELTLDWEDSWKYAKESPLSTRSPMSVPALGLAYRVRTQVESVAPGSAAEKAGLKADDVVTAIRLYADGEPKRSEKLNLQN